MLKDKFRFSKASTFDTFFDGEQAGYVPKTKDIAQILPAYLTEMNSVIAARQFVEEMAKGKWSDGRPILDTRGTGTSVEGEKGKAVLVMPEIPGKETSDYVRLDKQPALHDWKWVTKDTAGNNVFMKGDLVVHPEVAKRLKNVLGRSAIKEWYQTKTTATAEIPKAFFRSYDWLQSETKRTMLGLFAPFHQVQEGTHAIGHRVNPFWNVPTVDLVNNPKHRDAAKHGVMLKPDLNSMNQFMEGFRHSGLVSKIPGIGPLADRYSNYLFNDYIPGLKYATYEKILGRNMHVYAKELASGKLSPTDVKILSGEQTNAAYGHLNYSDLAHSPTMQHLAQWALLAPDFLEARMRFAGQAIKGATGRKIGREQIIAVGTLAAAQATLAWMSSKATGGQWDWKDPFSFHVGNRKFTMRSVPEDLYRLLTDTRAFVYARLNPLGGRGIVQGLSGTDWRGQKVTGLETAKELGTQPIPLTLRPLFGLGNSPLAGWEQLLGSAGIVIKRYSAQTEMHKKAHDWMADSNDPKIKAADERYRKETFADSDYKPLREALINNDYATATQAFQKLLQTKDAKQIDITMNHPRPMTGNQAWEPRFVNSLSPEDRVLYNQAKSEQRELMKKYHTLRAAMASRQTPMARAMTP